jgi:hypothetical protein
LCTEAVEAKRIYQSSVHGIVDNTKTQKAEMPHGDRPVANNGEIFYTERKNAEARRLNSPAGGQSAGQRG